jgi:hypothetical protein
MSLNSAAHAAGLRHGVSIGLRSSATTIAAGLRDSLTALGAKRQLATIWQSQRDALQQVELGAFTNDPKSGAAVEITAAATLTMLSGPAFDDVPLIAAGLRLTPAEAGATWTGRPALIDRAVAALRERGAIVERDGGVAQVRREGAVVATLVEDPAYEESPREGGVALRKQPSTLLWLAVFLLLGGLIIGGLTRPILIPAFVGAAVIAWIAHRIVRARHNSPRRLRIATLAPLVGDAVGAPYRGDAHARDRIEVTAVQECLRGAEFAVEARGNALQVATPGGGVVELTGLRGASPKIADLTLRFTDPVTAIVCAHALSAATGPLTVGIGAEQLEIRSPAGLDVWRAQHARERQAIDALVDALALGRDAALAAL